MNKRGKTKRFFYYSFFPKNRRGLSAIITTLLVVLLVMVAVGIVWGVIRNIVKGGAEGLGTGTKCLNIDLTATAVDCSTPSACSVTLKRVGSNTEQIGGVKLIFFDKAGNSGVINEPGNVEILAGKKITVDSKLSTPNKIEVTVYLKDDSGNEKLCPQTTSSNIGVGIGGGGDAVCGDGTCDANETCGGTDIAPECNSDCGVCPDAVCGDLTVGGAEECDSGGVANCINTGLPNECTCEVGFIPDPNSNGCIVDNSIICDGVFDGNEQCDGGLGCIAPGEPDECTCQVGYIPTNPSSADCIQITYIDSGTIDNVWPPGSGIYFDDSELPKEDGLYYGKASFFPTVNNTQCFLIIGYSYEPSIYTNAIVELDLFEPLNIATGDDYQIWGSMQECTDALA